MIRALLIFVWIDYYTPTAITFNEAGKVPNNETYVNCVLLCVRITIVWFNVGSTAVMAMKGVFVKEGFATNPVAKVNVPLTAAPVIVV